MSTKPEPKTESPATLSLDDQKKQKELEKLDAEISKTKAETAKATIDAEVNSRPFWKGGPFWTAVAAIGGLIFSWLSGWFDIQRKGLEADKKLLTIETNDLEKQKANYLQSISVLTNEMQTLKKAKDVMASQLITLKSDRDEALRTLSTLQSELLDAYNTNFLVNYMMDSTRYKMEVANAEAQNALSIHEFGPNASVMEISNIPPVKPLVLATNLTHLRSLLEANRWTNANFRRITN